MENDTDNQSALEQKGKPWVAPEMTLLPVEATATQSSTGNDGNGPTTHS